ncbi:GNAT family N-acetyltransferase [[Clostridium] fimetarium]|uniref:Protein N-acetyltransferase, RimJ/RimL family n=1 Tax=[Clostridium] fimetarium TaxID=99656 RepID=A0A1I0RIK7_9FIRM|nr:GNAT family protein [[Clostridium] fimetarium]SEW40556.1 Protein N-acetyltransferase, RimJ/RimL family [[Clostridium] fimetarium]
MILKNGCVTLRAIEKEDFELLFYLINAPEIEEMIEGWNLPISSDEQKNWIQNYSNTNNNIKLMIELSNGKTIGMIMLTDIDWKNRQAAIGYKISAPAEDRIKGDMKDAINAILTYAFYELGLNCIRSLILEVNIFSVKLAKKLNFQMEGILRERIFKNGIFNNQIMFSILKAEYEAFNIVSKADDHG